MIKRQSAFIYLLFIGLLSFSIQPKTHASELAFFDQGFGDFSEELEVAKEEGKSGVFIFFEILLYTRFTDLKNIRIEKEKPKLEYLEGKRVHVYTHPAGIEGGVFSKTYVEIGEHNILRLRTLMIAPDELWKKVEKKSE